MEGLRPLCPAVAAYLDCTKAFTGSTRQLLVSYGESTRGQGLSKGSLSRWLRDIISRTLVEVGFWYPYRSRVLEYPK